MKIAKMLGTIVVVLKVLAQLLKWGVIPFSWDLPGSPLLYQKLQDAVADGKITSDELNMILEQLKLEAPFLVSALSLLQTILAVTNINWEITGHWEKFWRPIVGSIADGVLDNREVGSILESILNA